jgi:hypothetical protein
MTGSSGGGDIYTSEKCESHFAHWALEALLVHAVVTCAVGVVKMLHGKRRACAGRCTQVQWALIFRIGLGDTCRHTNCHPGCNIYQGWYQSRRNMQAVHAALEGVLEHPRIFCVAFLAC